MNVEYTDEILSKLERLFDKTLIFKTDLAPSDWYEGKLSMPINAAIPGKVSYKNTPYWKEVVDRFSPHDPAIDITVMGPAQMGKTFMFLNPVILHTIDQDPCNIMLLTGHSELTGDVVVELDKVIDEIGIRHHIKPADALKARKNRTGDTLSKKEFSGFSLWAGSVTNHNMLRFYNAKKILTDDLDAALQSKKGTGNTVSLVKGRTKAYGDDCKRGWISTPQMKGTSLIYSQYLKSDQRYFYIPCRNCKELITLDFKIYKEEEPKPYGLTWKVDRVGRIDPKSVHYICPICASGIAEKHKRWFLNEGRWQPTAVAKELEHYGYSINGLYAAVGMTNWTSLLTTWRNCHPPGQPRIEDEYQTFINIDVGIVYEPPGTDLKASQLMRNIRKYEVGTVPEKQSIADGNGRIVLLTLAADLGGLMTGYNAQHDDVRLDYEVIATSENGTEYSVTQKSIGTFTPAHMGKRDPNRELWTYDISKPNNVWKVFDQVVRQKFPVDTGRQMPIAITGIDTGFAEHHVWNYIDRSNFTILGLKGDKDHKYTTFGDNSADWRESQSRAKLYLLKVSKLKDKLAERINLKWEKGIDTNQPPGFMNFPEPAGGQYDPVNYFEHYESEERKIDPKTGNFLWQKKEHTSQNHFFDVRIYHMAIKEILMYNVMKDLKHPNPTWPEFCQWLLSMLEPPKR